MKHLTLCCALFLACCSSSSPPASSPDASPSTTRGDYDPTPFGGARPVQLYVPNGYSDAKPAPLLILLHGYSGSGFIEDLYLNLRASAEKYGLLYAHPDGKVDSRGYKYWNATNACCDFDKSNVDDSKYLSDLVIEIETRYKVDPKRVYFVGHSNGAFMSYRMACDHADIVAGVMTLAGATWLDTNKCKPSAPVAILHVHGTADSTILYGGGSSVLSAGGVYPGAVVTTNTWATYNGCAPTVDTSAAPLDLEASIPGAETTVSKLASGCKANGQVELWAIQGGSHIPGFTTAFDPTMIEWLLAHPKP